VPLLDCPPRYRSAKRQGDRLPQATRSASRCGALGGRTFAFIPPRANPFFDLLVRYSFVSVERCHGRLDARDLPFVDRKDSAIASAARNDRLRPVFLASFSSRFFTALSTRRVKFVEGMNSIPCLVVYNMAQ